MMGDQVPDGAAEREPRFAFGKNWTSFLASIDESRIAAASASLTDLLGEHSLQGRSFLDIGCGSGLSSLAAHRAGAVVRSFDFDPGSVHCTESLKRRFGQPLPQWEISQGSILDVPFAQSLGQFDVVYSWGVLHHTGELSRAVAVASNCVVAGGCLVLAIYNDQGGASRRWAKIKRMYHRLPAIVRPAWVGAVASLYELKFAAARLARGRSPLPWDDWRAKKADRGMSVWHDWVDWIGGWPFEVASPDAIIKPLAAEGFHLIKLRTVGSGWGCNEYVLRRGPAT